jgi:hypothetical protein
MRRRRSATLSRPLNSRLASRTTTLSATSVSPEPSSEPLRSSHLHILIFGRLPNVPRPRMSICILADANDIDRAKAIELEYMSVDDLKK